MKKFALILIAFVALTGCKKPAEDKPAEEKLPVYPKILTTTGPYTSYDVYMATWDNGTTRKYPEATGAITYLTEDTVEIKIFLSPDNMSKPVLEWTGYINSKTGIYTYSYSNEGNTRGGTNIKITADSIYYTRHWRLNQSGERSGDIYTFGGIYTYAGKITK